jgi:hypothetical protein
MIDRRRLAIIPRSSARPCRLLGHCTVIRNLPNVPPNLGARGALHYLSPCRESRARGIHSKRSVHRFHSSRLPLPLTGRRKDRAFLKHCVGGPVWFHKGQLSGADVRRVRPASRAARSEEATSPSPSATGHLTLCGCEETGGSRSLVHLQSAPDRVTG